MKKASCREAWLRIFRMDTWMAWKQLEIVIWVSSQCLCRWQLCWQDRNWFKFLSSSSCSPPSLTLSSIFLQTLICNPDGADCWDPWYLAKSWIAAFLWVCTNPSLPVYMGRCSQLPEALFLLAGSSQRPTARHWGTGGAETLLEFRLPSWGPQSLVCT